MSPEQARGLEDVDSRSDVWSFCAMLYEVVSGATPFSGANHRALLRSIVEDEPRPLMDLAAADERLWAVVRRGLSKNIDDRFRTMNELGRALAGWLIEHGVHEDVSGGSLETKWIGRTSDPAGRRVSRASFASLTSSPPESGTRSVIHSAETLVSASSRPGSVSHTPVVTPSGRRLRFGLVLGLAAALAVGLAFVLDMSSRERAGSSSKREPRAPLALSQVRPVRAAPPPEVSPVHSAADTASAVSAQPQPPPRQAAVPLKREKKPLSTGSVGTGTAVIPAPVAPKSDLLSPY
jgi:serine/threonine-protein kinase